MLPKQRKAHLFARWAFFRPVGERTVPRFAPGRHQMTRAATAARVDLYWDIPNSLAPRQQSFTAQGEHRPSGSFIPRAIQTPMEYETMMKKGFTPSANLIRYAQNLLLCMAIEQQVRPVVEAYETEILAKHQFKPAAKWRDRLDRGVVLDRKSSFLLSDEDAKTFYAECFAARDKAGLKVSKPENCPLLEAENTRRLVENVFIDELGKILGLDAFANGFMTLEMRAKVIETGLRLVAPFVGNSNEILQRVVGEPRCTHTTA